MSYRSSLPFTVTYHLSLLIITAAKVPAIVATENINLEGTVDTALDSSAFSPASVLMPAAALEISYHSFATQTYDLQSEKEERHEEKEKAQNGVNVSDNILSNLNASCEGGLSPSLFLSIYMLMSSPSFLSSY